MYKVVKFNKEDLLAGLRAFTEDSLSLEVNRWARNGYKLVNTLYADSSIYLFFEKVE